MTYFWLLLLAHGVADFLLQSDSVVQDKCQGRWQGYWKHGLNIFVCTFLALHFFGLGQAVLAAGTVAFLHLAQDWLKNLWHLKGRQTRPRGVVGLLVDQSLHIWVLGWVWYFLDRQPLPAIASFYRSLLPVVTGPVFLNQLATSAALYVFGVFGGAIIVRMCLNDIFGEKQQAGTAAGKYIGILERILIITLIFMDSLAGVALVFTAKSIARFDEISKNREFAEYYLVGTLLSLLVALGAGLLLKALL